MIPPALRARRLAADVMAFTWSTMAYRVRGYQRQPLGCLDIYVGVAINFCMKTSINIAQNG